MEKTRAWIRVAMIILIVAVLASCNFVIGFIYPNEFVIDGATYETTKLYAVNWGLNDDGNYNVWIFMVPDTMSINSDGYPTGQGDYAWFWINTTTPALAVNDYAYNPSAETFISGTLYYGGAVLGFGSGNASPYFIEGGVLDISEPIIGEDFILDYSEGGLSNGGQFEVKFRGELEQNIITGNPSAAQHKLETVR